MIGGDQVSSTEQSRPPTSSSHSLHHRQLLLHLIFLLHQGEGLLQVLGQGVRVTHAQGVLHHLTVVTLQHFDFQSCLRQTGWRTYSTVGSCLSSETHKQLSNLWKPKEQVRCMTCFE
jgi:hypothetical protein